MTASRATGFLLASPLGLLLLLVFVAPVALMLPVSLHPYDAGSGILPGWTLANYIGIFSDPYYAETMGRTLQLGLTVTLACVLLGLPVALVLARLSGFARSLLTLLVVFPLLLNLVVRCFGWIALLANHGLLNNALQDMQLIARPLRLMFNLTGLTIGMTHLLLPFMVLMLTASLRALPRDVEAAAATLGAGPFKTFALVTLPLVAPGLFAGSTLVFVLSISALVTPRLLGGPSYQVMATVIYDEFLSSLDWPSGAALAFVLTAATLLIVTLAALLSRRWTAAR